MSQHDQNGRSRAPGAPGVATTKRNEERPISRDDTHTKRGSVGEAKDTYERREGEARSAVREDPAPQRNDRDNAKSR